MREGRAFWRAGGAGGVLDVDGIVELKSGLPLAQGSLADLRTAREKRSPITAKHDNFAKVRTLRPNLIKEREIIRLAKSLRHDEEAHARLREGVAKFGDLIGGVDVYE